MSFLHQSLLQILSVCLSYTNLFRYYQFVFLTSISFRYYQLSVSLSYINLFRYYQFLFLTQSRYYQFLFLTSISSDTISFSFLHQSLQILSVCLSYTNLFRYYQFLFLTSISLDTISFSFLHTINLFQILSVSLSYISLDTNLFQILSVCLSYTISSDTISFSFFNLFRYYQFLFLTSVFRYYQFLFLTLISLDTISFSFLHQSLQILSVCLSYTQSL